jgi:hypothetical protein
VGWGDRIAAVLPELAGMLPQPLLTLERLRIVKRDGVMVNRPQHIPRTDKEGRALFQKIMIFTSRTGGTQFVLCEKSELLQESGNSPKQVVTEEGSIVWVCSFFRVDILMAPSIV